MKRRWLTLIIMVDCLVPIIQREQIKSSDRCSKLMLESMRPFRNVLMPLFFSSVNSRKWQSCVICDGTKLVHCDLLYKIKYIMGCDAAGGLWHHPRWRYLGSHLGFYPKLKIINKTADIEIVDYETTKHYSAFCQRFVLIFLPKRWK